MNNDDENLNEQLSQYNIYINFLNDYYKQKNPKPFYLILSIKAIIWIKPGEKNE